MAAGASNQGWGREGQLTTAGYIRVSTEEQARDGYSLDSQRRRIEEFCAQHGWTLGEVYADEGVSAAKPLSRRHGMRRLLDDAGHGLVQCLVFWKVDRFGRVTKEMLDAFDQLEAAGVRLACIQEPLENTPIGRFQRTVLAGLAQWERETIILRIRENLEEKAKQGELLGSLPIGYRRRNGVVELDPERASLIRELFERYAVGGLSLNDLAAWAESVGLRTVNGAPYDKNKLRKVLRNPAYVGDVAYYTQHRKTATAVYPGKHSPLIDRAVFRRVQEVMRSHSRTRVAARPYGRAMYPLTGVAFCGGCGAPIHGSNSTSRSGERYRYLRCGAVLMRGRVLAGCDEPRVRAEVIEAQVAAYIAGMALPEHEIQRVLTELEHRSRQQSPAKAVQDLERQIERWRRLFVMGDVEELAYRREVQPLRQRLALLNAESTGSIDLRWATRRLQDIGSVYSANTLEPRRLFVHEVFARMTVKDGQLACVTPRPVFSPLFIVDRRLRFGQPGPDFPRAAPLGVLNPVPARGLEPPHPAPEAGALSD